jgi:xyloglucan-specific exo-beta-1,4-glucanase
MHNKVGIDNLEVVGLELERTLRHPNHIDARYVYHSGYLYKRENKKVILINEDLPLIDWYDMVTLVINPANELELWFAFGPHGLYHSTDGGKSFAVLLGISMAEKITFTETEEEGSKTFSLVLTGRLNDGRKGTFFSAGGAGEWIEVKNVQPARVVSSSSWPTMAAA